MDRRSPAEGHVRAPGAGARLRGSDGEPRTTGTARGARRPARPAVRGLRRRTGAGRADGAGPPGGLRPEHAETADAPGHPGERCGRTARPGRRSRWARHAASSGCRTPRSARPGSPSCSPVSPACSRWPTAPCSSRATRWPTSAGRHSRSPTRSWRCSPTDTEVRGLRAVVRLGLARRPARVDDAGVAPDPRRRGPLALEYLLLRAGLDDAAYAASGSGRFALEAAISGVHSIAPSVAETDWARVVDLYTALEQAWPSPLFGSRCSRPGHSWPCPTAARWSHRGGAGDPGGRGSVVRPARRGLRTRRPDLAHRSAGRGGGPVPGSRRDGDERRRPTVLRVRGGG